MFDDYSGSSADISAASSFAPGATASSFRKAHDRQAKARQLRLKQLQDGITELAAHMDAALCRWLELVCEFDDCNGWDDEGYLVVQGRLTPEQGGIFNRR